MILALQYWQGDEARALRLARLIADNEPRRRRDCMLALVRRHDCELSPDAQMTQLHCASKMTTTCVRSRVEGAGWPDGCNALWLGTMLKMVELSNFGRLPFSSIFTFESDCVPISKNWIGRLIDTHRETLRQGKRITGALMQRPVPHFNGNMIIELSAFVDHPSFTACPTPSGNAWDCWHAPVTLREGRHTPEILNFYNAREVSEALLVSCARDAAIVHGVKDDSAYDAALAMLIPGCSRRNWLCGSWNVDPAEGESFGVELKIGALEGEKRVVSSEVVAGPDVVKP